MSARNARRVVGTLALGAILVGSAGCYHSIIETGLEPSATTYHEEWATAWLAGLVPARVDASGYCGGAWAKVETQQSFLNGFVSMLTLGIYAPHEVEVTCAAGGMEDREDSGL